MEIDLIKQKLKEYFSVQKDIELALLFGSIVSGRRTAMSDIDIATYLKEGHDEVYLGDRQIDITCDVMRLCGINRVDVVVLNLANPFLRFQVMKNGWLLYAASNKFYYGYKASSFGRYQDIKSMYDLYDNIAITQLKKGL